MLGCHDIGLGVIRALSARDVKIMAIPNGVYDFANFSRFVAAKTNRISPEKENTKLLDFLLDLSKDWDRALILPTNDPAVVFTAQNREALSSRFIPATQDSVNYVKSDAVCYNYATVEKHSYFLKSTLESLPQKVYSSTRNRKLLLQAMGWSF